MRTNCTQLCLDGGLGNWLGMFDDGTMISTLPPDTFYSEFIWLRWAGWDRVSFKDRILVKAFTAP